MPDIKNEETAKLAYGYWEAEGRPDGRATEHWLRAEKALDGISLKEAARTAKKLKKDAGSPKTRRTEIHVSNSKKRT